MKKILLVILGICLISTLVSATEEVLKDTQKNIISYKITVELTPEEYKAIAYDCYSVDEWINNAAKNKARQMIDIIYQEELEKAIKDPNIKTISTNKIQVVRDAKIKSGKERQEEFEASLSNKKVVSPLNPLK